MLASYIDPDLLAPAFVACSTNVGEGLVKLSHVQWHTWTCGGVAHSFCTAISGFLNPRNVAKTVWCPALIRSMVCVCGR